MARQLPTFVVAGAARSGSTAVIESLRKHPDVFVTQPKEPHFLALAGETPRFTGPDDDTTINRVAVTGDQAYRDLFPADGEFLATGEGSVSTLYYHDDALPRLYRLNPDVRVVLVLREPVARAFSSHQYLLNRGSEPLADFLDAVAREQDRIDAGWHHLWHYTAMSRYAESVRHTLDTFGTDQVGVWWYDDLTEDPIRCLTEIHDFIGVTPPAPDGVITDRVNSSGRPRRAWLQTAMQQVSKHAGLRTALRAVVPFELRERIRNSNLAAQDVPALVRSEMAPVFEKDLSSLEAVLGRSVPASWRSDG